jgi:hypothetical protein
MDIVDINFCAFALNGSVGVEVVEEIIRKINLDARGVLFGDRGYQDGISVEELGVHGKRVTIIEVYKEHWVQERCSS